MTARRHRLEPQGRLLELDQLLQLWRPLWHAGSIGMTFADPTRQHAALAYRDAVRADPDQAEAAAAALLPDWAELQVLIALSGPESASNVLPDRLGWHMPGRKWAQIRAFAAAAGATPPRTRWVECCAGKAHLGRTLRTLSPAPLLAIDADAALCEAGQAYCESQQPPVSAKASAGACIFLHADLHSEAVATALGAGDHLLALHACGDLHVRVIELAGHSKAAAVTLSPCCYNRTQATGARSRFAQSSTAVPIDHHTLRLPLTETVTANGHARRAGQLRRWLRQLQHNWRNRGNRDRLDPSRPALAESALPAGLRQRFEATLLAAARPLPTATEWEMLWRRTAAELQEQDRLNAERRPFARAIEVWLGLDLACALQEQGYQVRLGTFCPREVTPRNLLLQGWR